MKYEKPRDITLQKVINHINQEKVGMIVKKKKSQILSSKEG
jgi:hypothetical protein